MFWTSVGVVTLGMTKQTIMEREQVIQSKLDHRLPQRLAGEDVDGLAVTAKPAMVTQHIYLPKRR